MVELRRREATVRLRLRKPLAHGTRLHARSPGPVHSNEDASEQGDF